MIALLWASRDSVNPSAQLKSKVFESFSVVVESTVHAASLAHVIHTHTPCDSRLGKTERFVRIFSFVSLWCYRTVALDESSLRVLCRISYNATVMEFLFRTVRSTSHESRRSITVPRVLVFEGSLAHYHCWKRKPFATLKSDQCLRSRVLLTIYNTIPLSFRSFRSLKTTST